MLRKPVKTPLSGGSMELTAANVEVALRDCLFTDDISEEERMAKTVKVEGILHDFGFDPVKLAKNKEDILSMLLQLPDEFMQSKGGGWTFLNACYRQDQVQWTGLHLIMEYLFVLGMAIGKVRLCVPREVWNWFPGGMPYYVVLDGKE